MWTSVTRRNRSSFPIHNKQLEINRVRIICSSSVKQSKHDWKHWVSPESRMLWRTSAYCRSTGLNKQYFRGKCADPNLLSSVGACRDPLNNTVSTRITGTLILWRRKPLLVPISWGCGDGCKSLGMVLFSITTTQYPTLLSWHLKKIMRLGWDVLHRSP